MKSPTAHRTGSRRHQRGLTLIELLVSLVIGLILMIAIVSAYLGSAGASRVAEAQGRMNEDGQAALSILTQQIRMAGNNPRQPNYAPDTPSNPVFGAGSFAIRGCDGTFTNVTTAVGIEDLTCAAAGGPDAIAVAYEADEYNTIKSSTNSATDCLGQALASVTTGTANVVVTPSPFVVTTQTVTYALADNRFYVGTSTAVTSPSLFCKGSGGATPQPLVENVEDMQFTFGAADVAATSTLTVRGYLTATEIAALATAPADDAERWRKVATVRICVLVRSELPVAPDANSAQYIACDGTTELNPPDLRLRRAYSTTVVLRNRMSTE